MSLLSQKIELPSAEEALPGRSAAMQLENRHFVNGRPLRAPFSNDDSQLAFIAFGLGCFWGAERVFWKLPGVITTAVGYGAGYTQNPSYEEVCTGKTGHNEIVLVVHDPKQITLRELLQIFFESHDPTQGMRQGNDVGTQYRSGIYFVNQLFDQKFNPNEFAFAEQTKHQYEEKLAEASFGQISTEVKEIECFYYAEQYHQQYLAKNPNGYCGIGGTGVTCELAEQ